MKLKGRPASARMSATTPSVVPTGLVDSRMTRLPGSSTGAIERAAANEEFAPASVQSPQANFEIEAVGLAAQVAGEDGVGQTFFEFSTGRPIAHDHAAMPDAACFQFFDDISKDVQPFLPDEPANE